MKSYDKKINQLINLYIRAEKRLMKIISTKTIKGNVTDFYESLLKQVKIELMKLQIQSIEYSKDIVNELYLEAYYNSLKVLDMDSIGQGFAKLHTDAINILSENLINNFAEVNNQVGRRIEDTIRDIGLTNTQIKFATGQTIKELQKELSEALINEGIGGIKDKRGRIIPFIAYAKMLGRSVVAETQNTSVLNVMKEYDNDLVQMTEHKTSCDVCAKFEGKIYSISGKDERYPALKTIPGFNKGYNNIHPNCRHRITPYIEKYSDEYIKQQEEKEKQVKRKNKENKVEKHNDNKIKEFNFKSNKEANKYMNDNYGFENSNIGPKIDINVINSLVNKTDVVMTKYPQLKGYIREFNSGNMKAYAYCGQKIDSSKYVTSLKVSTTHMDNLEKLIKTYEKDLTKNFHPKGTTWEDIIVHEYGHVIEGYLGAKRAGINNPKWKMSTDEGRKAFGYFKSHKISKEIVEEAFNNLGIKTNKEKYDIISNLSKYSTMGREEFFAEAFADAMSNGENAQDISKEIIKIIDREMKK